MMTELDAGLEYDFWDKEVNGRKLRAIHMCEKLNAMPMDDEAAGEPVIRELFAHTCDAVSIGTYFNCNYGLHISVGKNFLKILTEWERASSWKKRPHTPQRIFLQSGHLRLRYSDDIRYLHLGLSSKKRREMIRIAHHKR